MRVDRPKPHEIKRVEAERVDGSTIKYKLFIQYDPCPVILLPGMTVCPICKKEH